MPDPFPKSIATMTTIASPVSPIVKIDALAANYAKRREAVAELVAEMHEEIRAVHRRYRRRLIAACGTGEGAASAILATIQEHPELFVRPKSMTLHGVQFGRKEGAGKLHWDDDEQVCARIDKHFKKHEAELLIKTTRKPIDSALRDLDPVVLKKLGVTVEATGEVWFVKVPKSEVDKLVGRLLKEGTAAGIKDEVEA